MWVLDTLSITNYFVKNSGIQAVVVSLRYIYHKLQQLTVNPSAQEDHTILTQNIQTSSHQSWTANSCS